MGTTITRKAGLCKYYQPLRLEKPSNFRLVPSVIVLFDNFKGSLVERGNEQSVRTNDFVNDP
jgi:hypothetical protein